MIRKKSATVFIFKKKINCQTCPPGSVNVSEAGGASADVSSYSDVDSSADSTRYTRLSVYCSNCRSVQPKMDDLRVLAEVDKPDILALCETWLGEEVHQVRSPYQSSDLIGLTTQDMGVVCCSTSVSALVQ